MCLHIVSTLERFSWHDQKPASCQPLRCTPWVPTTITSCLICGCSLFSTLPASATVNYFRGVFLLKSQIEAFAENPPKSSHLSQKEKVKIFTVACKVTVLPGPVNSKFISHNSLPHPWCSRMDGLFVVSQTCQAHPNTGTYY